MSSNVSTPIKIATNAASHELAAWQHALDILSHAFGGRYCFELAAHTSMETALADPAALYGLSLLGELQQETSFTTIEATWRSDCAAIPTGRVVFVSTILRHLPNATPDAMARIRRLNLLAVQLSQRFGLLVIDIDRMLAHHGALALQTDAELSGANGQAAAARVIAGAVLSYGLNGPVEDKELDLAIAAYEATAADAIDRLTVAINPASLKPSMIGARVQRHIAHQPELDERGGWGILRDLRYGRVSLDVAAAKIGRKMLIQVQFKLRSWRGRIGQ